MKRVVLIAAAVGLALLWAPSASAALTYGSNGCGKSEFQPELIGLACADGKVEFEVREWTSWEAEKAVAVGTMKHVDLTAPGACQRTVFGCPWVESEGTATFSRPVGCPSNGRRQFTRLRIVTPEDKDPELRDVRREFSCNEYSTKPVVVRWLGNGEAKRFMREALSRNPKLAFEGGYARKVRCNKRISRIRIRCKMSWIYGDLSFSGKGQIWLTFQGGDAHWNYAYRVRKTNAYCLATGGSDCVETITVR